MATSTACIPTSASGLRAYPGSMGAQIIANSWGRYLRRRAMRSPSTPHTRSPWWAMLRLSSMTTRSSESSMRAPRRISPPERWTEPPPPATTSTSSQRTAQAHGKFVCTAGRWPREPITPHTRQSQSMITEDTNGEGYALITGASAGLGAEFARQLAAMGHHLILVARREDRLQALAAGLTEQHGVTCQIIVADLNDEGAGKHIADTCQSGGWTVNWLVNNAGVAGPDLLQDRDWAAQQTFFQLMMLSVADLCHRFIPGMVDRGYGRVINVASVAARVPRSGGCNYGPAKAYLVALSEELNLTVAAKGVHVSAICPGFTHTDFHETAGLMEMKNNMAKWLWYDADVVVRDAIRGVEAAKPVVVSGRLYRWLDPIFQSVWTRRLLRIKARPEWGGPPQAEHVPWLTQVFHGAPEAPSSAHRRRDHPLVAVWHGPSRLIGSLRRDCHWRRHRRHSLRTVRRVGWCACAVDREKPRPGGHPVLVNRSDCRRRDGIPEAVGYQRYASGALWWLHAH